MTLYQFTSIGRTSAEFRNELPKVAARLKTDPNFLAAVMQNESGFDPAIRNPMGGATGLIQFMPQTAKGLGTTTDKLAKMSDADQLFYVEKFYEPHAGSITSAGTAYMLTFLPAFAHKPDSFVLGRKDDESSLGYGLTLAKVYRYNPGFDNGSGEFTVGDVKRRAENTYAAAKARGLLEPTRPPRPKAEAAETAAARRAAREAERSLRSAFSGLASVFGGLHRVLRKALGG